MFRPMSSDVRRALSLCLDIHKDDTYGDSTPYAVHPICVANRLLDPDDASLIVALLHDSIEDHGLDDAYFIDHGISDPDILDALHVITRTKDVLYKDYLERVARNKIAAKVKLADLEENLDAHNAQTLSDSLKTRYETAYASLPVSITAAHFDDIAATRASMEAAKTPTWRNIIHPDDCECAFTIIQKLNRLNDAEKSHLAALVLSDYTAPPALIVALCHTLHTLASDDLITIIKAADEDGILLINRIIAETSETPLGDILNKIMG